MSDPLFLVFDTSAAHCAAAVFQDDVQLSSAFVEMTRGQGEALVSICETVLSDAGCALQDLTALGVGIGPGNFTGTRISVAFARGLTLTMGRPAIGISTFDLMRDPYGYAANPAEIVSVPAPREQAYVQHFRYGIPQAKPRLIDPASPPEDLRLPVNMRITGHRAPEIARPFDAEALPGEINDVPYRLGKVTSWKWSLKRDFPPPAPLYVRPANAAPSADPPPVILP